MEYGMERMNTAEHGMEAARAAVQHETEQLFSSERMDKSKEALKRIVRPMVDEMMEKNGLQ